MERVFVQTTVTHLRDTRGTMTAINTTAHEHTQDLAHGDIAMYDTGFQRGMVRVTVVSHTTTSYVLTHGVPFLADFCKQLGGVSKEKMLLLAGGFVVDLPKGTYEATQSRERARITNDLKLAFLDMCWLAAVRILGLAAAKILANTNTFYMLEAAKVLYGLELQGLGAQGDIQQNIPGNKNTYVGANTPDYILDTGSLVIKYPPFLPANAFTATLTKVTGQTTLNQWVHVVHAALRHLHAADQVKKAAVLAAVDKATESSLPVARARLRTVLQAWFVNKTYDDQIGAPRVALVEQPPIIYPANSQIHRLFNSFIRLYIKYGMSAGITGFRDNMVHMVQVGRLYTNKGSYFQPGDKLVFIDEADDAGDENFTTMAENVAKWCRENAENAALNRDAMEQGLGKTFLHTMGYGFVGRSAAVHEMEHARRGDNSTAAADMNGIRGTWKGILVAPAPTEEITFNECHQRTFTAITAHIVDKLSFHVALARTWAADL